MIFTCGLVSLVFGYIVMFIFGTRVSFLHNKGDSIGSIFVVGGFFAMLYSIGKLLWSVMP